MFDLVDPVVHGQPEENASFGYAPRGPLQYGARLVLIDNGKAKAKILLKYLAESLQKRLPIAQVEVYEKGQASRILDDEEVSNISSRADVVIAGVGDCGACSACSLADAIKMERVGVPSTVLITDVFLGNVAEFSNAIGFANYHSAVVPHPVSSKSDEKLKDYADSIVEVVIRQLTDQL